ncbi:MAG: hypothetical protein DRN06_05170 [Thermoprotei archaeon]|nr:MAG: hypothetical protein DRN06_05170 [Thermoprotei archaeon]
MRSLVHEDLERLIKRSAWRLGLFKRRLIHVARRFGALSKRRDVTTISVRRLMEAFKDTAIEEEAYKEFMSNDVDLEGVKKLLSWIEEGSVKIVPIHTETPSPLTRRALERASRKTELIPPERMHKIIVESAKARLLNEVRYFTCTNCWEWYAAIRILDLDEHPSCPRCGSRALAPLDLDEHQLRRFIDKHGKVVSYSDRRLLRKALKAANLVERYGKPAAFVLAGRGVSPEDAEEILREVSVIGDKLAELVIDAERNALRRRFL